VRAVSLEAMSTFRPSYSRQKPKLTDFFLRSCSVLRGGGRIGFISYQYFAGIIPESVNAVVVRIASLIGFAVESVHCRKAFVSVLFFYSIYSPYLMRR